MDSAMSLWCLCMLGFFKEFRPSQSFLTPYLEGPRMNFTQNEVNQEIFPIGTYSTLLLLIVVFLITDILCFKPVIIVHCVAGLISYSLITFGTSKFQVQAAEVAYGLFMASEVAYFTYMYASCERELYQKVTSYTRIALQLGRLGSDSLGQLLISCQLLDLHQLNFLTLGGLFFSCIFAFLLPSVHRSLYFHRIDIEEKAETVNNRCSDNLPHSSRHLNPMSNCTTLKRVQQHEADENLELEKSCRFFELCSGFKKISSDFSHAYSNLHVIKWSLWWAFAQCGYLQVSYYVQNLWQDTALLTGENLYNGAASASYTILAVLLTWCIGLLRLDFTENKTLWLLAVCSLMSGALITSVAVSHSLVIQYTTYGVFKILFQIIMIFANSEVAKSLNRDSQGLIFGFNTFVALLMQTCLTIAVAGSGGLELSIRLQFYVYGSYYIIIGGGFVVAAIVSNVKLCQLRSGDCDEDQASNEANVSETLNPSF